MQVRCAYEGRSKIRVRRCAGGPSILHANWGVCGFDEDGRGAFAPLLPEEAGIFTGRLCATWMHLHGHACGV